MLKLGQRELQDVAVEYTVHPYDMVLGVYFAQARMYDATSRRFLSVDWIGGTVYNPKTFSAYVYCFDHSLAFIDPFGLFIIIEGNANAIQTIYDELYMENYDNEATMSKKRKIALLVCCVILLLPILYITANAFFVTVEVFSDGGSTYALRGSGMITLYHNRILIESKVNWRAENNGFVRLFQIPQRVRVLPKEDYKRVLELVDVLAKKDSEISPEIVGMYLRMCIIAGRKHHYIVPFVYGTPEAVELHQILYSCLYSKELSSRTYK